MQSVENGAAAGTFPATQQQSTSYRKLPITDAEFESVPRELLSTFYRLHTAMHDRASNEACRSRTEATPSCPEKYFSRNSDNDS